jgi:4-hydroxy-tetrahydrodipicolinate reductase
VKLALVGYGRMGREVERLAVESGHEIVARLGRGDRAGRGSLGDAQVAIEFSRPEAAADNLEAIAEAGVDAVCGTTGWSDDLARVTAGVEGAGTGLVYAPNFSLGVALFRRIVREAAALVDALPEYDLHLHETHHRHKVDHPSGTARALADDIVRAVRRKDAWSEVLPASAPVDPRTLGVSVARVGEVPGTHALAIEGPDDDLELRHRARSRGGFARGALEAAAWIHGRRGVFTLDAFLADRFGP